MYSICDLYHLYVQKKFKLNIVKTQLQEEDGGGGGSSHGIQIPREIHQSKRILLNLIQK